MKMTRFLIVALVGVLAAGCNTPASRIRKNQEIFDSFPPEAREKVKQGSVDIGFTRPMVHMALGAPNRVYTRRTAAGQVEVLAYTAYETHRDRQRIEATVRVRDASGARRTVRDWVWVDVDNRNEYDRMRVEMIDDKVTAIEETSRVP